MSKTVFEGVWESCENPLFKSEEHGVMAVADAFPKFPYHTVLFPREGEDQKVHVHKLARAEAHKLYAVKHAIGAKILEHCDDEQRIVDHTEGFAVPNHAHIVLFAALRGEGKALYDKAILPNSEEIIEQTIRDITLSEHEGAALEDELDVIRRIYV